MPIYCIRDIETHAKRVVRAANPAQALRHVTRTRFAVRAATADAVAELLAGEGLPLEDASHEAELPPRRDDRTLPLLTD